MNRLPPRRRNHPEWLPQQAVYVAWPYRSDEWGPALFAAQREWAAFVSALVAGGQQVRALVLRENEVAAQAALSAAGCPPSQLTFLPLAYDDIWLRDTAPWFLVETVAGAPATVAVTPNFNGWGKKFSFPLDESLAARLAEQEKLPLEPSPLVLEGGALETNGNGLLLTTRACLLHPQRNPNLSEASVTAMLKASFAAEHVGWIDAGLQNDHTDGHIDTLARFSNEHTVLCMQGSAGDPNAATLSDIQHALRSFRTAGGRPLEVVPIPSPGAVLDDDGEVLPASYLNFVLTPTTVIVPTYGGSLDAAAVHAIGRQFPSRRAVGRSARAILSGGGAFHCISKELPDLATAA